MSISLSEMVEGLEPSKTVLFFGAGSSLSSGAPSVNKIIDAVSNKFKIEKDGFTLSEITSIAEEKRSRKDLVHLLRELFKSTNVTGSLLTIPLYKWKNIYTTNYDTLIEQAYKRKNTPCSVISSNYDFTEQKIPDSIKLYKLHGTIDKDISDGTNSRIIISESDYDNTSDYREALWDALKLDLCGSNLIIIGYSLADQHIKDIVNRAISINNKSFAPSSIYLLLYTKDENRALLFEKRGLKVAFGGVDDFFVELQKSNLPNNIAYVATGDPLDSHPALQSVTINVADELSNISKNVAAMFQGWPATYSDIKAGVTFSRTLCGKIYSIFSDKTCATILGASGTGKSTLARQVILKLKDDGFHCWEHKSKHKLMFEEWRSVAAHLKEKGETGILFIDDAHEHIYEINSLVDLLSSDDLSCLKLIFTSSRNNWIPRIKTSNIFSKGEDFFLKKLDESEIESLLTLVDTCADLQPLVESSFSGFNRIERKRRLTARCESDTFVCLKNIFASEQFDNIILREFAELDNNLQEIYRLVSAMESAGVNVHRQMIIRLLGIPAQNISASLTSLVDIVSEYSISEREGIYGWKGRHPVITGIIAKYKMTDENEYINLFEKVIDNIIPTYDIEIKTIRQLCSFDSGISRFPNKQIRNKLLRKMISKVPGERVPRHRLIRYLIDTNELDKAETEIRLFDNDFGLDGPTVRFKIMLMLARAERTAGILNEDRVAILEMARENSVRAVDKYKNNKNLIATYCDVGIEYFKRKGDPSVYDDAIDKLKEAEQRIGDPDITTSLIQYERAFANLQRDILEEAEA